MTQITSVRETIERAKKLLRDNEKELVRALPAHLDKSRMMRVYLTALNTTPRLGECDALSIVACVFQAAQFGLSIDTIMGEAFLVPRWNKNRGCNVAQFQLGYKGYVKLARNADSELRDIFAHVAHENDEFTWELGMEPKIIKHVPALRDRGALKATYAVGVWKDGYKRIVLVGPEEIEKVKQSSDSYKRDVKNGTKDSPWFKWEDQMWRKTALRRFGGSVPISGDSDFAKAMEAETIDGSSWYDREGKELIETTGLAQVPANAPVDEKPAAAPTAAPATATATRQPAGRKHSNGLRSSEMPAPVPAATDAAPARSALDEAADEFEAAANGNGNEVATAPTERAPEAAPAAPAAEEPKAASPEAPAPSAAAPAQRTTRARRRNAAPADPPPADPAPPPVPPPAAPAQGTTPSGDPRYPESALADSEPLTEGDDSEVFD